MQDLRAGFILKISVYRQYVYIELWSSSDSLNLAKYSSNVTEGLGKCEVSSMIMYKKMYNWAEKVYTKG